MSYLSDIVLRRIQELGVEDAAAFFEVTPSWVKQWRDGSKPVSLAAVEKVFDPDVLAAPGKIESATWEGKQVCILLPFYRGCGAMTCFSLLGLLDRTRMRVLMRNGDAFIAHSRNALTKLFLETECEWSFWVDDDIILPIGNAKWYNSTTSFNLPDKFAGLHTINRLLAAKKNVVGGLYFGRTKDGKPMYAEGCRDAKEQNWIRSGPHDVVKPTRWVATGCLLVHRQVYLDIAAKFPHLNGHWFTSSQHDLVRAAEQASVILRDQAAGINSRLERALLLLDQGQRLAAEQSALGTGEDIQFCLRASQAGHQPHIDAGLWCGHVGKQCYGAKNV